jgi:hypothetical protein
MLLICIDGFPVEMRPLSADVAADPLQVLFRLTCWGEDQGYAYCQAGLAEAGTFQIDFTTSDGTPGTAYAAVFSATRH